MLIGQYCKVQFETIRCYLQAQKIYWLSTKFLAFSAFIHFALCYGFIYKLELGVVGAGIANSSFHLITLCTLMLYLTRKRYIRLHPNSWHRFNQDSCNHLGEYLKNGFPYGVMRCLDHWGFQLILIFASWIGETELATYIILSS